MSRFKIAEAKARFSELVEKAMMGEEVVIARGSKAVVRLVPFEAKRTRRTPGSSKGKVWMAKDFAATPDEFDGRVRAGRAPRERISASRAR